MSKRIGFHFFRPYYKEGENGIIYFNLQSLFEGLKNDYLRNRERSAGGEIESEYKKVYSYNDEPARLADIQYDEMKKYYHLTFERLNYEVPNRTTLHGESKALELAEDEWIGFDVSVLYDPRSHILMIQRNRDSLGPNAIEKFIHTLLSGAGHEGDFSLAMVSDPSAKRRAFRQSAYRKIQIRVTGAKANTLIQRLRQDDIDVGVDSVEISFNSSPRRAEKIDDDFSKQILEEYIDDPEVKRFQIRSRENEEDPVEPIDLIDHKLVAYTIVDYKNDGRQLNPISVFEEMIRLYEGTEDQRGFKYKVMRT